MSCGSDAAEGTARPALARRLWPADNDLQPVTIAVSGGESSPPLPHADLPEGFGIDRTAVRANGSARGGKGAKTQTTGRSRGVPTSNIHALTDGCGRAVAFTLSPENQALIRSTRSRKAPIPDGEAANKNSSRFERAFCRLSADRKTENLSRPDVANWPSTSPQPSHSEQSSPAGLYWVWSWGEAWAAGHGHRRRAALPPRACGPPLTLCARVL